MAFAFVFVLLWVLACVAAMLLACGTDAVSLAAVSNLAGGWVCERVGVVPIPREALESELSRVQLPHPAAR